MNAIFNISQSLKSIDPKFCRVEIFESKNGGPQFVYWDKEGRHIPGHRVSTVFRHTKYLLLLFSDT